MTRLSEEEIEATARALEEAGSVRGAAGLLGVSPKTIRNRRPRLAEKGLIPPGTPTMPGYAIKSIASKEGDAWIRQTKEHGDPFEVPPGHSVKGVSALVDAEGRIIQQWHKTHQDSQEQEAAMKAAADAFAGSLPRAEPVAPPSPANADLLNQYTITDAHMGALAWAEETGDADYDLRIAEQLLLDWMAAAVRQSPDAATAVFAQLGDLLHHDSHLSVTPASGHVLDADSRFQKMVRTAISVLRQMMRMQLERHEHVHVIMADDNHAPASATWLREMFAAFYDSEPRVSVDSSPSAYYCYEHGLTSLFYHHGHKRGLKDIDSVFAGRFREVFGRTCHSYAHIGHLHSNALQPTNLMEVERHETLAAPDAYTANSGYLSGRSAKVITYHREHGEVGRQILTPQMVAGAQEERGVAA